MAWDGCRWEVTRTSYGSTAYYSLLREGWEPFSVDNDTVYFRRPDPREDV